MAKALYAEPASHPASDVWEQAVTAIERACDTIPDPITRDMAKGDLGFALRRARAESRTVLA